MVPIADLVRSTIGAKPPISQGIESLPMGVLGQQSGMLTAQRQPHALPQTTPVSMPQAPKMASEPKTNNHSLLELTKSAMATDAAGIPTTGPESIYYALQHLDLKKKQDEAENVVRRKLKSKRPFGWPSGHRWVWSGVTGKGTCWHRPSGHCPRTGAHRVLGTGSSSR